MSFILSQIFNPHFCRNHSVIIYYDGYNRVELK
jgi:hypothetical protein